MYQKTFGRIRMKLGYVLLTALVSLGLSACENDAQVASYNLSQDADNFKIPRRTVFYNGITGDYMLSVEGFCSIKADGMDKQLELVCKDDKGQYKKHFLGLSDNVTYFSEQMVATDASAYHYKVTFKPQLILSDVDVRTSTKSQDLPKLD